jgi:purine nucleosidase
MPLQPAHAVDFLIETLRGEPSGTVTLCPLGPLTNIATAFRARPTSWAGWQEIVLMGGAYFEVGNVTPAAEFNIYVDPEAAAIVFGSGVPITVMPLDVTHKVLTTRPRIDAFRALGTQVGEVVASWTDFFERFDMEKYGPRARRCMTPASSRIWCARASSPGGTSTWRSRRNRTSRAA